MWPYLKRTLLIGTAIAAMILSSCQAPLNTGGRAGTVNGAGYGPSADDTGGSLRSAAADSGSTTRQTDNAQNNSGGGKPAKAGGPALAAGAVVPSGIGVSADTQDGSIGTDASGSVASASLRTVQGQDAAAYGQSVRYTLNQLSFIDAQNGWMLRHDPYPATKTALLATSDGGATWRTLPLPGLAAQDVTFANVETGWLIAQTDCAAGSRGGNLRCRKTEILSTVDGGNTWTPVWSKSELEGLGEAAAIKAVDANHLYAIDGGKLLVSSDGGTHWMTAEPGTDGFTALHADFASPTSGWVIGRQCSSKRDKAGAPLQCTLSVLKSKDFGSSWSRQFSKTVQGQTVGSAGIAFPDPQHGYFLVTNLDTWEGGLYATGDGGKTWTRVNRLKSVRPTPSKLDFVNDKVGWIPLDPGAGPIEGGMALTTDGGRTITSPTQNEGLGLHDSAMQSAEAGYAIGTNPYLGDYLIHTADGGRTWTQLYPEARPMQDVQFLSATDGFGLRSAIDRNAVLHSGDGGTTWQTVHSFGSGTQVAAISFRNKSNGWALLSPLQDTGADNAMQLWRTSDGGRHWKRVKARWPNSDNAAMYGAYLRLFDGQHGVLAYVGNRQVNWLTTSDGGLTWTAHTAETFANGGAIGFSFPTPDRGYAYSQGDKAAGVAVLELDGDGTWKTLGKVSKDGLAVSLDFLNADTGWMLIEEHAWGLNRQWAMLITADGGKNWTEHIFPQTFHPDSNWPALSFADLRNGWLAVENGIYRTDDSGLSWRLTGQDG